MKKCQVLPPVSLSVVVLVTVSADSVVQRNVDTNGISSFFLFFLRIWMNKYLIFAHKGDVSNQRTTKGNMFYSLVLRKVAWKN